MRVRAAVSGIFASVAILAIGWQFGSAAAASFAAADSAAKTTTTTGSGGTSPTTTSGTTTTPSPTPSASASGAPASGTASGGVSGTFVGATESTQFGNVQVEIVVASGKITNVKALHLTDRGGRSVSISNQAAPILRSEVLSAQSARVDGVSGATYTTEGYLTSVQSAIDKAGL